MKVGNAMQVFSASNFGFLGLKQRRDVNFCTHLTILKLGLAISLAPFKQFFGFLHMMNFVHLGTSYPKENVIGSI